MPTVKEATARTEQRIANKKATGSASGGSSSAWDAVAKQVGGRVVTGGKGQTKVEYQVSGTKDGRRYKSTRYINSLDEAPNYNAPEASDVYASDAGIDRGGLVPDETAPEDSSVKPEQTGRVAYEDALKGLEQGGLAGAALQGAQNSLANAYGKSKYETAHQQLQQSGAAPGDAGQAMSQVFSATPQEVDQSRVDAIFSEDPVINGLMSQAYELMSPDNLKGSLMGDYKKLYKESGLKDINEELIDAETILDGTEDDIRNEIQTAGGLATDSQVQAMTLARNKGLLKRYNQLFAMKQSTEQQLQTMLNLSAQDRQMAMQRATNQINTLFQFANFRQQSINAYKETARWALTTMGADNLYASMKNDPVQAARYEKMMGLPAGGLATAAAQAAKDRSAQAYLQSLQIQGQLANIEGQNLQNQKLRSELTPSFDPSALGRQAEDIATIDDLMGRVSATGTNFLARLDPLSAFTGKQQNFIADVEQLRGGLTLDRLAAAKGEGVTFGALSDGERQLVAGAATKIGTWAITDEKTGKVIGYNISDKNLKDELQKIQRYQKIDALKQGAQPESIGVSVVNGKYFTKNWDGTVTQLF